MAIFVDKNIKIHVIILRPLKKFGELKTAPLRLKIITHAFTCIKPIFAEKRDKSPAVRPVVAGIIRFRNREFKVVFTALLGEKTKSRTAKFFAPKRVIARKLKTYSISGNGGIVVYVFRIAVNNLPIFVRNLSFCIENCRKNDKGYRK